MCIMHAWLSALLLLATLGTLGHALRTQLNAMPTDAQLRALFSSATDKENGAGRGSVADRFDPSRGRLLQPLLRPRAPGTAGNLQVQQFLRDFFARLGDGRWRVETDTFQVEDVPVAGRRNFTNIIATWEPQSPRFLTLAAHFDTKWPNAELTEEFLGATDSAGPMAILLDVAEAVTPFLMQGIPPLISLQFVFFDGEEAFRRDWKDPDNTYGSRHLAAKWSGEPPGPYRPHQPPLQSVENRLQQMDALVLLDLLGSNVPWPRIPVYFEDTRPLHQFANRIESRLLALGLLSRMRQDIQQSYFDIAAKSSTISDDHLPFIRRFISCLHVIPSPFPDVWHSMADNATALVPESLDDFSRIIQVFTLKYLDAI